MEQVFAEIKESVEKEAEQLVRRAKRVADREIQHAKEEAVSILNSSRKVTEKEAKLHAERAVARIKADVKKQQLEQQQEFIQEIFDVALLKLKTLPRDDKYAKWIKALLNAGLSQIPNGNGIIFCNEKDIEIIKKLIPSTKAKLSEKNIPISGGIIVKSQDGRLTIDCSAEAEMRRAKEELRDEVLKKLNLNL